VERDALTTIVGLIVTGLVAAGAVFLLFRGSAKRPGLRGGVVQGYPAQLYPARDIVGSAPLSALAATQERLLTIYEQSPPQSDLTIWLTMFLRELRAIMDVAYRVVPITRLYGNTGQLDRIVTEVQQIEVQIAELAIAHLLHRDADPKLELLDGRLDTLRLCARELGATLQTSPVQQR